MRIAHCQKTRDAKSRVRKNQMTFFFGPSRMMRLGPWVLVLSQYQTSSSLYVYPGPFWRRWSTLMKYFLKFIVLPVTWEKKQNRLVLGSRNFNYLLYSARRSPSDGRLSSRCLQPVSCSSTGGLYKSYGSNLTTTIRAQVYIATKEIWIRFSASHYLFWRPPTVPPQSWASSSNTENPSHLDMGNEKHTAIGRQVILANPF